MRELKVRYVENVYLPGDEIRWHLARARARDARLTRAEYNVRYWTLACLQAKRNYPRGRWRCSSDSPCNYCREAKALCD